MVDLGDWVIKMHCGFLLSLSLPAPSSVTCSGEARSHVTRTLTCEVTWQGTEVSASSRVSGSGYSGFSQAWNDGRFYQCPGGSLLRDPEAKPHRSAALEFLTHRN